MHERPIKLLLVEDDASFAFIVKGCLELSGKYEVTHAIDGQAGIDLYHSCAPDIIVSDVEMPGMSGLDMVRAIRLMDDQIPIFFATARTQAKDLIQGFGVGVDNYIRKPYLPEELNAHILAVLKRKDMVNASDQRLIPIGEYLFNETKRTLQWQDKKFNLTQREVKILLLLYQRKGKIVRREDILSANWGGPDFYNSRSLDVFVSKLRKYLAFDPKVEIRNVRGEGIQLLISQV